ncbi:MAG: hypothetical protein KBC26_02460 [Candidatus Pacebacteria bacterium]|nr:hypothetical protein [Candidatus Paceibacterota bacterium]
MCIKYTITMRARFGIFLFVCCGAFWCIGTSSYAYETVLPGGAITIGEFVYDDDFQATTTPCTVSVYNPSGGLAVNTAMTAESNGWHYYVFTGTTAEGTWPTLIQCGSTTTGDLIKMDKTFYVGYAPVVTSTIPDLVAQTVWGYATRTLSSGASIVSDIWGGAGRSLTTFGTLVSDVWSDVSVPIRRLSDNLFSGGGSIATEQQLQTATSTLQQGITSIGATLNARWDVSLSNVERVLVGKTYRAKVSVLMASSTPADSYALPLVTLYDADRNAVVSAVAMTKLSAGVYEYTYSVPGSAAEGLWETVVTTEVEAGKTLTTNDYWSVEGSPAQVIINGVTDTTIPDIVANVTITNEGLTGYEYHYEWCVVAESSNTCGDGDDMYYASASKYINAGEDWNTNLTAVVSSVGSYLFKLVVYYGTEQSGSSRTFTAQTASAPPGGGGGAGGGGGTQQTTAPTPSGTPLVNTQCRGADFNLDSKVNSIDFSILLAFWKTASPFKNPCVDINTDLRVDSVDFSILMYQWGKKGI